MSEFNVEMGPEGMVTGNGFLRVARGSEDESHQELVQAVADQLDEEVQSFQADMLEIMTDYVGGSKAYSEALTSRLEAADKAFASLGGGKAVESLRSERERAEGDLFTRFFALPEGQAPEDARAIRSEVRQAFQAMAPEDRHDALQKAIREGDVTTVRALSETPATLSGFEREEIEAAIEATARVAFPEEAARVDALTSTLGVVEWNVRRAGEELEKYGYIGHEYGRKLQARPEVLAALEEIRGEGAAEPTEPATATA